MAAPETEAKRSQFQDQARPRLEFLKNKIKKDLECSPVVVYPWVQSTVSGRKEARKERNLRYEERGGKVIRFC